MGQWDSFMERLERTGRRIFASDPSIGSRGLFERFGVAGFIGDLGNQLDSLDTKINPFLDRFEAWLRRAGAGLSPLKDTVQILADRFRKWAEAGQEMLPTWEKIRQVIDDFNKDGLPKLLDWVERNVKAMREWADEIKRVGEFWNNLLPKEVKETLVPGGALSTVLEKGRIGGITADERRVLEDMAGERIRRTGALGEQERLAAEQRLQAHEAAQARNSPQDIAAAKNLSADALRREMEFQRYVRGLTPELMNAPPEWEDARKVFLETGHIGTRLHPDVRAVGQAAVAGAYPTFARLGPQPTREALGTLVGSMGAFYGTGARGILPTPDISPFARGFNPTQEQHRVLRELDKYLPGEALSDYGKFQERLRTLAGLRYWIGAPSPIHAAVVGGAAGFKPQITEEKYRRGVFDAYEDLEKKFGKAASVQLAPAAKLGSQEAMDTFNRSLVELTSPIDRLASVMNEAQLTAASLDKTIKEIMPSLLDMAANAGVVIGRNP
jgi:hypothetical protein